LRQLSLVLSAQEGFEWESQMTLGKLTIFWADANARLQREEAQKQHCNDLGGALNLEGNVGETVDKVQKLIFKYYNDVRDQEAASFKSAKRAAFFGFILLAVSVLYVIGMDVIPHIKSFSSWFVPGTKGLSVAEIGLIGGGLVEFLAGVQFFMHGRTARQFGAFHICLERTHRYLLAYKMAEQIKVTTDKDKTLEEIVCIMANAPMITRQDIEGVESGRLTTHPQRSRSEHPTVTSPATGEPKAA